MRAFYTLLFYLLLPFIFLRLWWRGRRALAYRARWAERLGFSKQTLKQSLWVHAVSVGETIAAIPLIKGLQKAYPDVPLVITNMTPTGAARVQAAFGDSVLQRYIPYDLPGACQRFIQHYQPRIAIIMETELWPNLSAMCLKNNVPILIANARLSEKSAQGYARIPWLNKDIFKAITQLAAQAPADAERFKQLGMPATKVSVTGNIKFDLEIPADLLTKGQALRTNLGSQRPAWIAASTHKGEEEIILAAHKLILQQQPDALLILVPRHPDRFALVADLIQQQGFSLQCRSQEQLNNSAMQVYLGDTMGELLLLYAAADIAWVGGSFANIGGHNMLEPAALHKPILSGPIMFNFAEVSRMLLAAKGMEVVQDAATLAQAVQRLMADKTARDKMGECAYQVVAANRGATARHLQLIAGLIKK